MVETEGVRVRLEHGDYFVEMLFEAVALCEWLRRYAGGGLDVSSGKRWRLASVG